MEKNAFKSTTFDDIQSKSTPINPNTLKINANNVKIHTIVKIFIQKTKKSKKKIKKFNAKIQLSKQIISIQ